jgi:dephospho-CoA kinase
LALEVQVQSLFCGKPIIGIVGGIGSGKSFVADLFAELGCLVIKSDEQVYEAYRLPEVKRALREWWGEAVFDATGEVDRQVVAQKVFVDEAQRRRLENLIHPVVTRLRDGLMRKHVDDAQVKAYVWDTPLLYEVGLDRECEAVVFVDAPRPIRLERVRQQRGWDGLELDRRENSQMALDKKRELAQYRVVNTADAASTRRQVEAVLSRVLVS